MNNCPICSGQLLTRVSSNGEDTWCTSCRNVIASDSLSFRITASEVAIEQCSANGLPGWKGPGAEARCYPFEPGNQEQEQFAMQKAKASAYMHKKGSHLKKMAIAYFSGPTPQAVIDGTTSMDDGVEHQPDDNLNNNSLATASSDPDFSALGRSYCTNECNVEHPEGQCPLAVNVNNMETFTK